MNYFYRFLALFLIITSNAVMAQEVSVDVAQSRAFHFLSNKTDAAKRAKGLDTFQLNLAYTSTSEGKTCFYVFNTNEDDGFVIVGGDEAAREILGYCDHGSFDYDKAPDNFKWWLSEYTKRIAHAEVSNESTSAKAASPRRFITPLIQTKWNQGYPYNSQIPIYDSSGDRYMTGCLATATAQVMYYYQWPKTGMGSHTYTYDGYTFSANFGATTYDWGNMILDYGSNYTNAQETAIGTLMYHVGVSLEMSYGTFESGAASDDIGPALISYFGYDKSIRNEYRDYFTDEEWEELIYKELSEDRPVLYGGFSDEGGHQFICDGYNSNGFHINWGWGGWYDGYFPLTPTSSLDGGGTIYDSAHQILINATPDHGGKASLHMALSYYADEDKPYLEVDNAIYRDRTFNYNKSTDGSKIGCLYCWVTNISCSDINNIDLGVKAIEKSTGFTHYWATDIGIETGVYYSYHSFDNFNISELNYNGVYELFPVCRISGSNSDNDWIVIDTYPSVIFPTITVTGATEPDHINISFSVESNSVRVSKSIQIEHDSNYSGDIVYSSSNNNIAIVDEYGVITGVSEGTAIITAKGTANGFYKETMATFEITVKELIKENVLFAINQTFVKVGETLQITWNDNYLGGLSFSSSDTSIAKVSANGTISGVADGYVIITATADGDTFYNNSSTTFTVTVYSGGVIFSEIPYFNNDNNPYEDDFVLYYEIKNATSETRDTYIFYKIKTDKYFWEGYLAAYDVSPDQETKGSYNFINDIGKDVSAGKTYTFYFYKDNSFSEPYDYPSLTFNFRSKVSIDYEVGSAGYGTLILPFDENLPKDMSVYRCLHVDNDDILILEEDYSIKRNTPYVVKASPGTRYQFNGPEAIDEDKPTFSDGVMIGAVTDNVSLVAGSDYILQQQNNKAAFYLYSGTPSSNPTENDNNGNRLSKQFRAFIRQQNSQNAPKLSLPGSSEEETTSIEIAKTGNYKDIGIFTFDGKRQSSLKKGLNLIILEDGTTQKVFVK